MTGYEMSAQPAIGAQGPFEIDERARFHELQIRPLPGFLEQIELREPLFVLRAKTRHRQAASVYRQAVANFEPLSAEL